MTKINLNAWNEIIKTTIGTQYLTLKSSKLQEESEFVREAFAEIVRVNRDLFKHIPYKVVFTEDDHYCSAKEMRERVQKEGVIYIYSGWSGHPFLTEEENNIGRAVHDVFAHLVCGCPFSFEGEYTAYLEQRKYYPRWTWGVLFAEIPGQTCAYYVNGKSHDFPQRAIVAPIGWMNMVETMELEDYSHNSILDMQQVMFA